MLIENHSAINLKRVRSYPMHIPSIARLAGLLSSCPSLGLLEYRLGPRMHSSPAVEGDEVKLR